MVGKKVVTLSRIYLRSLFSLRCRSLWIQFSFEIVDEDVDDVDKLDDDADGVS